MGKFTDIFEDVTKQGCKIQTSEYMESGKYPIIDQGQKEIAGYTDKEEGLFTEVPAIIFGDHTRVLKYVDTPCFLGADGVKLLKAKIKNPNHKYLFYALSNVHIPNTGYNRHFKWLKEAEIKVPSQEVQLKIVTALDKLNWLVSQRQRQLIKLDQMVKSQFIELFGDASMGKNKYPVASLDELCSEIRDGEHATVKRTESGHLFISSRNIKTDHRIVLDMVSYVNDENFQKIRKRFAPRMGDILLTCAGTIGNSALIPDMEPFVADRGLTMLRPDVSKVMPEYLHMCLTTDYVQEQMKQGTHATALAHLYLNKIKSLRVIMAPLDLQKEFISVLQQADKSKFAIQQSLEQLETLKKSLMQEYFG